LLQTISIVIGVLATLLGGGRWLISVYYLKAEQVEELKRKYMRAEIQDLREKIKESKDAMIAFQKEFDDMRITLVRGQSRMESVEASIKDVKIQFERTAEQLESRYKALENAELIQVKDNTFIMKTRKFT
jgi:predicted  nucleic acid-binding Zn-ribbon protein